MPNGHVDFFLPGDTTYGAFQPGVGTILWQCTETGNWRQLDNLCPVTLRRRGGC
jgi:hypothetical protein